MTWAAGELAHPLMACGCHKGCVSIFYKHRWLISTVESVPTAQHVQSSFVWGALHPIFLALPVNSVQDLPQAFYQKKDTTGQDGRFLSVWRRCYFPFCFLVHYCKFVLIFQLCALVTQESPSLLLHNTAYACSPFPTNSEAPKHLWNRKLSITHLAQTG